MRLSGIGLVALGSLLMPLATGGAGRAAEFDECQAPSDPPVARVVACRTIESSSLGGTTAFSYYLPPRCDPVEHPGRRCPVLYLLHGFGGDYRSMLGTAAQPSAWVRALTAGPPVDPRTMLDPWRYADPAGWGALEPLDLILVAPHGKTVGHGPLAGVDGFWTDWNPRFAAGGDSQRYPSPPPRFTSFLIEELIPSVEAALPAAGGRDSRALAGVSLGGYGAYKNGLQHPDVWTSIGSVSGAHNFLLVPGLDPVHTAAPGVAPPAPLPHQSIPSASSGIPLASVPEPLRGFAVPFLAFGDPVADGATYRGNMPRDLAMNGRASAGGETSLHIRGFVNDAVPRRAEDFQSVASYLGAQAFEALVLDMNVQMETAFTDQAVERSFEIHPGIHSGPYWNPFLRAQIAAQYARVRHWDGGGHPPPAPTSFDFRTVATDFDVWSWSFHVDRAAAEFLNLRGVSCDGLTLQGTGVVSVTVPSGCGTGLAGKASFEVDLGEAFPFDEQAGASALPLYGSTAIVELEPLP